MRRFDWFGSPQDTVQVIAALLREPGVRLLSATASGGKLNFFDSVDDRLLSELRRQLYVLVAGPFTVDIQTGSNGIAVVEYSGPLLYLAVPIAVVDGRVCWDVSGLDPSSVGFRGGFLGLQSSYYYRACDVSFDPTAEAGAYFRRLVGLMKSNLMKDGRRWVGGKSLELAKSGACFVGR